MLTVYGSEMCPDCIECKANFEENNIEFTFIDINEQLKNLKDFLKMRDENPVFDHCKEIYDIGLPAIVKEDGEVFLDWEGYLKDLGKEVKYHEQEVQACSLDRKGC